MATAAKKKAAAAPRSVARSAAPVLTKAGYRVRSHVVINREHFDDGDVVTDLTEKQATELLELGVIEKTEVAQEEPPAE